MKKVFIEGPISSTFIGDAIAKHQSKTSIGAHNIFLGQVRADEMEGKSVAAIEYTCYEELANEKLHEIREEAFQKFDLICMHIYHSLGTIKTGEVCFFVFVSAKRRKEVYSATEWIVNQVKDRTPIFGKEIFEDQSHQWKVNS
ncbi:molybdenum cofactor biosynthesis protein MoaE [Leeuwenhoekiella nanhaiensis]|uniref:Molybdopterin synthase catalytic subunit n=1 Tax=Leeuwenhoekiella nanhaiensis TaxID=1655491 RepID=A0A2G1VTZ9_9FLAO|nr:molybdenum cofactor biosynthesis protein MoaE [Leeuwenhoekiella nanhaiensis]PHQ30262.1 molybdopterin converting factor [Leeuwenhoekiella nanhaiensis]